MPSNDAAALYLRSSKDRADISPAAQRRALEELAASRSLSITQTFEDAVESGSSEDRPGFQALVRAVKDPARRWSQLLVYDTSRIARRRYIAQAFKHELKKRGIAILYATRPADLDPMSEVVLDSMLEAMDEVHSIMSREKGLAGMAENVRQGWRAGGRAPFGYRLVQHATGAIREGKPVTKSRLEPSEFAHQVSGYLKGRASGVPRVAAVRVSGLSLNPSSLIGMEWNALTYAGHTVWNIHRETGAGTKRRPRTEWHIHKNTHPALVTEREAETILSQLESSNVSASIRRARAASSTFLLSGLLYSTDGRTWAGHGKHYRLRKTDCLSGRIVPAELIDQAVIETLHGFRTSDRHLAWLLDIAHRDQHQALPGDDIRRQIRKLERERQRAVEAAISSEAGAIYAQVAEQRGRQIEALRRELEAIEREAASGASLRSIGFDELRQVIEGQDPVKIVRTIVERVVLEPSLECQVRLRQTSYNALWRPVASPGGAEAQTQGVILRVAGLRRR